MDNSCDYSHRPHYKSQIHLYIWKLHVSPHTIHIATQFTSKFLQEGWSQSKGRSAKSASQRANLLCKVRIYCFRGFFCALAASVTDIQKGQVKNYCSQKVCIKWAGNAMYHGPWDQAANTNCIKVTPPQCSQCCLWILILPLPFQKRIISSNMCLCSCSIKLR